MKDLDETKQKLDKRQRHKNVFLILKMILKIENFVDAVVKTAQIKDAKYFWVKMKDVGDGLGLKNMSDMVIKEIKGTDCGDCKKYKCSLQEITGNMYDSMKIKYIRNDIAEKIIKNCRGVKKTKDNLSRTRREDQKQNFRLLLGFAEHDLFLTKEQSIINKLLETFSREEISLQHFVLGYKIDAYFVKYKLAVEIDEHNHEQRDNEKELMRENAIKQKLGSKFIRINPDDDKFNINIEIGRIFERIKEIKNKEISELKEIINNLKIQKSRSKSWSWT